jgi:hypothetical protein
LLKANERHASTDFYLFIVFEHKVEDIKKESPDVETPGLLVKALISSYFMIVGSNAT